jgi:LysM repeat protein
MLKNKKINFVRDGIRCFISCVLGFFLVSCGTVPSKPAAIQTGNFYASFPGASLPRQDIRHVMGPGETVFRVSKMYDVPMDAILKANRIADPKELRIGQSILVPDAASLRCVIPLYPSHRWRYIVIHHSVTDTGDASLLDSIHRQRGFDRGLGYHFVIDNGTKTRVDGQIEASPRWIKQLDGAHCNAAGMNSFGIGICLVGDFTHERPSRKQMDSLVLLINTLSNYYNIPLSHVIRHKDVPGKRTACPGNSFPWQELKNRLRDKR